MTANGPTHLDIVNPTATRRARGTVGGMAAILAMGGVGLAYAAHIGPSVTSFFAVGAIGASVALLRAALSFRVVSLHTGLPPRGRRGAGEIDVAEIEALYGGMATVGRFMVIRARLRNRKNSVRFVVDSPAKLTALEKLTGASRRFHWREFAAEQPVDAVVITLFFALTSTIGHLLDWGLLTLIPIGLSVAMTPAVARSTPGSIVLLIPYGFLNWVLFHGFLNWELFRWPQYLVGINAQLGAGLWLIYTLRSRSHTRLFRRMANENVVESSSAPKSAIPPSPPSGSGTIFLAPIREHKAANGFVISEAGDELSQQVRDLSQACIRTGRWQSYVLIASVVLALLATVWTPDGTSSAPTLMRSVWILAVIYVAGPRAILLTIIVPPVFRFLRSTTQAWRRESGTSPQARSMRIRVLYLTALLPFAFCQFQTQYSSTDDKARDSGASSPVVLGILVAGGLGSMATRRFFRRRIERHPLVKQPLSLLLLRVFRPGSRYEQRISGMLDQIRAEWSLAGTTHLLGGPDWLGNDAGLAFTIGLVNPIVTTSQEQVEERFRRFHQRPKWRRLAGEYEFPVHSMLCDGAVWTEAFHGMLDRADVVLMDLREFDEETRGCAYELGQLVRRLPTWRFLLIVDDEDDKRFIREALKDCWDDRTDCSDDAAISILTMQKYERLLTGFSVPTTKYLEAERRALYAWLWSAAARARRQ